MLWSVTVSHLRQPLQQEPSSSAINAAPKHSAKNSPSSRRPPSSRPEFLINLHKFSVLTWSNQNASSRGCISFLPRVNFLARRAKSAFIGSKTVASSLTSLNELYFSQHAIATTIQYSLLTDSMMMMTALTHAMFWKLLYAVLSCNEAFCCLQACHHDNDDWLIDWSTEAEQYNNDRYPIQRKKLR